MKYAHLENNTKKLLGWYSDDVHSAIPIDSIAVEDEIWQEAININANCYIKGKFLVKDFRTDEEINEDLIKSKRTERDNVINSFIWRIERNSQELELNLETTDNRLDLLNYIQYLRDIPNNSEFPNIGIKSYEEFLESQRANI